MMERLMFKMLCHGDISDRRNLILYLIKDSHVLGEKTFLLFSHMIICRAELTEH